MHNKIQRSCDVLIVLNSLSAEGCPQLAYNLSRYWLSKGIKVQIISLYKYPLDMLKEFEEINVRVDFYGDLKKGFIRYFYLVFFTYIFCKKFNPYSVLCFPFGWHCFIALGAKLSRVKNVCTHVGNYPPIKDKKMAKFKLLVHLGRLFTKKCICCSDYIMNATVKYFSLPNKNICRIYNCCDFEKFKNDNQIILPFKKTLNLGMVARLEKHKDQATLIKAIPKILKLGLEVNLFIIGDGSKRKNLEELSLKLGIGERVNFMGSRMDIPNILSKLDIFIFSAKEDEGFGIALAEAMVAGLPILASDAGACLEILNNGEYGYLFKKGNSEDLALKVLQISKDFDNVKNKILKAKKYAKTNFSVKNMADSYLGYLMS